MRLMNSETSWGVPARLLHWAVAGVILFLLGLGTWMTYFVDDVLGQFRLVQIHKSWGFIVFSLALVRIVWRLRTGEPRVCPITCRRLNGLPPMRASGALRADVSDADLGLVDGLGLAAAGPVRG